MIRPGAVVKLPEAAYQYGRGDLTLRVIKVRPEPSDGQWVWITGVEILWTGAEGETWTVLACVKMAGAA